MTRFLAENNTFYHGTYNDFLRFRPLSHFGSIYAAKYIINLGSGYKTEPIGSLSDIKVEDVIIGCVDERKQTGKPKIIPVKLKLKNTYELQDVEGCHDLYFYKNALLFHFIDELKSSDVPMIYDYITDKPLHNMSWKAVKKELAQDTLYAVNGKTDEATDRYHLVLQRMIHYFEGLGFDGFHYTNNHEDPGHISYVPFRPESIVRLDVSLPAVNYDFKPAEKINIKGTRNIYRIEETSLRFEKIYHIEMLDKNAIGRNQYISAFLEMLDNIDDNFTIFINGDWGTGKTFFVKQVYTLLTYYNQYINNEVENFRPKIENILKKMNLKT